MLRIETLVCDTDCEIVFESGTIYFDRGGPYFAVLDGPKFVANFQSREDAELFVRAKEFRRVMEADGFTNITPLDTGMRNYAAQYNVGGGGACSDAGHLVCRQCGEKGNGQVPSSRLIGGDCSIGVHDWVAIGADVGDGTKAPTFTDINPEVMAKYRARRRELLAAAALIEADAPKPDVVIGE